MQTATAAPTPKNAPAAPPPEAPAIALLATAPVAFEMIPLETIKLSDTPMQKLRRERFDKAAMAELAESVKVHGVIQPVLVRPVSKTTIARRHDSDLVGAKYELVAGERRYLASKAAGRPTVPAIVRELTDLQVVEMQVIENNQREDLHELVEAEGFEQLMKVHKLTAADIAAKISKSQSYVYGRLKFCALCPEARKAFYDGKISASVALEIARHIVPHDVQRQALKDVTKKNYDGEVMSFRDAARHIRHNYLVKLAGAPFDIKDEKLVAKAGSCVTCPKRSSNQPQLFADEKTADVCTDSICFSAKRAAHADNVRACALAKGQIVIAGAEAKKIAPHGSKFGLTGYTKLDDEQYAGGTYKKVGSIIKGASIEPALLQDPKTDELVPVVSNDQLKKAMQAQGIGARPTSSSGNSAQRAAERKARLETEIRRAIVAAIHAKHTGKLDREDLQLIAQQLFDRSLSDNQGPILAAWGVEPEKERHGGRGYDKAARKYLPTLNTEELGRALIDMALMPLTPVRYYHGAGTSGGDQATLTEVAKRLKVDADHIRKELTAAAVAKLAAKKTKKKKPATKTKRDLGGSAARSLYMSKYMQQLQPKPALAAIVGDQPLARTEITKKIWAYIKKHGLQDEKNRRLINADEKLQPIFGGKKQLSMFELTKVINAQLGKASKPVSPRAKKKAAKK